MDGYVVTYFKDGSKIRSPTSFKVPYEYSTVNLKYYGNEFWDELWRLSSEIEQLDVLYKELRELTLKDLGCMIKVFDDLCSVFTDLIDYLPFWGYLFNIFQTYDLEEIDKIVVEEE